MNGYTNRDNKYQIRFKKFLICQLFELFKYGVEFSLIGSMTRLETYLIRIHQKI
jgi:hypothetical protein